MTKIERLIILIISIIIGFIGLVSFSYILISFIQWDLFFYKDMSGIGELLRILLFTSIIFSIPIALNAEELK